MSTKVLHVIDNMCLGGAQRIVSTVVGNNNDHRLHVLRDSKEVLGDMDDYTLTESSSRFNLRCFLDVWRQIRIHEPDIVHCHLKKSKITGLMVRLASRKDFKLVFHEHGQIWKDNQKYNDILNYTSRIVDRHIAVSQHTAKLLSQKSNIPENKLEVIYNFVDRERFNESKLKHFETDLENVVDSEKFTVGFGGRLVDRKGWKTVVEAAEKLDNDIQVLMTGSGDGEKELREKAEKIENLNYLGYLDDVRSLFSSIDCFVLPSEWDPSPMILYEVHSCGIPLISSDAKAIDELVKNNENGLVFETGNSNELSEKINRLSKNRELQAKLKENGLASAEKYSYRNFEKELDKLYQSLSGS